MNTLLKLGFQMAKIGQVTKYEPHFTEADLYLSKCVTQLTRMASVSTCEGMLRRPPKTIQRWRLSRHRQASSNVNTGKNNLKKHTQITRKKYHLAFSVLYHGMGARCRD